AFPQYALHEQLLACVVGVSMDVCRERLATAKLADEQAKRGGKESRCWEQEFRPASRALMRLRDKLKPFALTLAPARRLGYSLMAAPNAPGHEHWPRDGSITSAAHGVPPEQQSTGG
ncbi:MAG: hypothetical protein J2P37_25245, partial [Ktedonobacteraceae bacterium]|nr:hypothetical protein [Ktedonobacteraceae bacterium]